MRLWAPLASVTALAAVVGLSLGGTAAPARGASDTWTVDPAHSFVVFRIRHMDIAWAYGRFDKFNGTLTWDDANPAACTMNAEIETASVDTGVQGRDDHLRSPDFFNAAQFPSMLLKSTAIKKVDATHFEVTGDLSMHGKTKSVTFTVERTGPIKNERAGKMVSGFHAEFTVKRSDFELGKPGGVGDEVQVTLAIEAQK